MIKQLSIRNFKTVRELDLSCKRYNLFIGDTNTGKTNILEALSLMSQGAIGKAPEPAHHHEFDRRIIRYGQLNDLFPGRDVTRTIDVRADAAAVTAEFMENLFKFTFTDLDKAVAQYQFQSAGNQVGVPTQTDNLQTNIRRYQFDAQVRFSPHWFTHLAPPDGRNLGALLMANSDLAEEVGEILAAKDVSIEINPETYGISLRYARAKGVVVPIAFQNLSSTLQRYIFLYAAVRTNKAAVLLLDEPEQNTYPFYTAHIAEIMAREESNQYFITTHNPYVLSAFVDKAPAADLQVVATYRKDGHTQARVLSQSELQELLEFDAFLNIDRVIDA